ncbi:MAG: cell division protein ZapA [Lachnospiraceae bacterium]|jgi:cell division protein ZapA (FtsZ GTPase activity inhibitor)|nr:cell division protein ZapA [Lachnospiraceae bacterium]
MENKNYTEVYIGGKVYTLGGFEEEEYLQKVAAYVNTKASELRNQQGFLRLGADYQNVLLQLNLADDVFKTRRQAAAAEKKFSAYEKETYNVKHDLVAAQMKLDTVTERLEKAERELERAREDQKALKKELAAAQKELGQKKQELEEAQLEQEIAKEELEKAQGRISQLEQKKNLNRR